jgi:kynureninase
MKAVAAPEFLSLRDEAIQHDSVDPAPMRDSFVFPAAQSPTATDAEVAYFAGNSLGLLPRTTPAVLDEVLNSWSTRAVAGHFTGEHPWSSMAESLAEPMARIVGAHTSEIVLMNTLTVNIHVLLAAFYRPTGNRTKIVIEAGAFPSDDYAVASQIQLHRLDPTENIVRLSPRPGEALLRTADIIATLRELGDTVAVVLLPGINFRTGQLLDVATITIAAHDIGAFALWDFAHAAGNVPLHLHDWKVDGAVWCTYKYLNAGPGAVGAAFIHDQHVNRTDLVRLTGWWGNNPDTRFSMTQDIEFALDAHGWQISNPPIFSLAPIRSALQVFDDAGGIAPLRQRSVRLTSYLESLVDQLALSYCVDIVTPRSVDERGAQLSLLISDAVAVTHQLISGFDVVPDERPPNIVRFAPIPLYTSYYDCWRAACALSAVLTKR